MLEEVLKFPYYYWVGAAVAAWALNCVYRLTLHPLAKFPGPKFAAISTWWYFYYIYIGRFPEKCEDLFDQYHTSILRVGPDQIVMNTPQSLKDVIERRTDVFRGHYALRLLGFAENTVSNIRDPAEHRRKRKLMNPGFSANTLAQQEPILIVPLVDKFVDKVKALKGTPINMCNYFDCATSDIIGRLSFGHDFKMLDQPNDHPFLHVLPNALKISVIAQSFPEVFHFLQLVYAYGPKFLTPKSLRGVADFSAEQMRKRAQRDADGTADDNHDIMSVILREGASVKDEERKMTQKEMLAEATTLVAGGGDTVATALSCIMFNLGKHQDVYKELQTKLRERFDSHEDISSKAVSSDIPLMDAVINETLRFQPVLPGPMWRRTERQLVLDGHVIPAQTEVGVGRLNLFHNKSQIHSPKEWIPRRWTEDMGDNLEACQPFGAGPHTCIGRYLGMVEMRLIVAKLLWHFDWELKTDDFDNPEYVVQYRKPLWFKATLRKDSK